MTLNVTSGIVYSSGPVITVNATPVNIFGAAGTSGTAAITHYSGALNVNISGGQLAVSVSGNIVLVVSGGTIQVSGVVSVSGNVVAISGGAGSPNISGGVTVSGGVTISGLVGISGGVAGLSGLTVLPYGLQSGQMMLISGGGGALSGVATSVSGNVVYISGTVGTSSGGTLPVNPVSGAYIYGYQYSLVSGAGIVNVQSGASVLHAININAWVSGGQLAIQDSLSGNAGASVGVIDFIEVGSLATQAFPPQTLVYDVYMKSGIVIVTSGAALNATVSFRNPV